MTIFFNGACRTTANPRVTILILAGILSSWSGVASAQWAVVDTALNLKAQTINTTLTSLETKFQTLNGTIATYGGPSGTAAVPRYVDSIAALNSSVLAGTGTYGATASAAIYPPSTLVSTPCNNGKTGILQIATPVGTLGFNNCELGRQVMAAAFEHSYGYYKKFAEYNVTIRSLIATPITNLNIGQLAALQFQVQSYQVLQQNETALFNANMEMHRTALDTLKERQRQIEKQQVTGKSNRDGSGLLKLAILTVTAL